MDKILIAVMAAMLATASLSGCGTLGKGKGKAPPPVAEPAPVASLCTSSGRNGGEGLSGSSPPAHCRFTPQARTSRF